LCKKTRFYYKWKCCLVSKTPVKTLRIPTKRVCILCCKFSEIVSVQILIKLKQNYYSCMLSSNTHDMEMCFFRSYSYLHISVSYFCLLLFAVMCEIKQLFECLIVRRACLGSLLTQGLNCALVSEKRCKRSSLNIRILIFLEQAVRLIQTGNVQWYM